MNRSLLPIIFSTEWIQFKVIFCICIASYKDSDTLHYVTIHSDSKLKRRLRGRGFFFAFTEFEDNARAILHVLNNE